MLARFASTCLLAPAPTVRWCHHPRCRVDDSLSLQELRSLLRDTWRSLCEGADQGATQGVGVGEWASRSLLTTRIEGLALNRVHVAQSSIAGAGDGVFASRDMAAGSLVTLYPGDALRVWGARDADEDSWWGAPGPGPGPTLTFTAHPHGSRLPSPYPSPCPYPPPAPTTRTRTRTRTRHPKQVGRAFRVASRAWCGLRDGS